MVSAVDEVSLGAPCPGLALIQYADDLLGRETAYGRAGDYGRRGFGAAGAIVWPKLTRELRRRRERHRTIRESRSRAFRGDGSQREGERHDDQRFNALGLRHHQVEDAKRQDDADRDRRRPEPANRKVRGSGA